MPKTLHNTGVWRGVKVFWTVMSMNYACLSFHVRS